MSKFGANQDKRILHSFPLVLNTVHGFIKDGIEDIAKLKIVEFMKKAQEKKEM